MNKYLTNTIPTQPSKESKELVSELMDAVIAGDSGRLKFLVTQGVDINAKDEYGRTALMWATTFNEINIVKLLIDFGVDVNVSDKHGYTALMLAAFYGFTDIVALLLEHGADVNKENKYGKTALSLVMDNNVVANLLKAYGGKIWSIIY